MVAVGVDPATLAGDQGDLLLAMGAANPETGLYGQGVYDHALVLLARAAANAPVSPPDIEALRARQIADGTWAFAGTTEAGTGDSNTTAVVLQALIAAGRGTDPMVEAGLAALRALQAETGGFPFQPGGDADANSTALAVQAIVAAGADPTGAEWRDAAGALLAFQNASGALRYTDAEPPDNLYATVQAIPALAGLPLPVATACPLVATPAVAPVGTAVAVLPAPGRGSGVCVDLEAA